jgi:hypothetical protein
MNAVHKNFFEMTGTHNLSVRRLLDSFLFAGILLILCVVSMKAQQNEPEAPKIPEKPFNGFQFAFYGGVSLNVLSGGYFGGCPCDFPAGGQSFSTPYGTSLNIPLYSDASIYLRLGLHKTSSLMSSGRVDSLRSIKDMGNVVSDLQLRFDLANFDVLLRLIGKQDGERVFTGISLGFVKTTHVKLTDTEYQTGAVYTFEDHPLVDALNMYSFFVIGAEYAFVPIKNLYLIPSFEIDYGLQKLYKETVPRPTFSYRPIYYKILLTTAYQIF